LNPRHVANEAAQSILQFQRHAVGFRDIIGRLIIAKKYSVLAGVQTAM